MGLTALVLGDARCVRDDLGRALQLFTPDAIAATNNIGLSYEGRVDYWVTLHPRRCPDWPGMAVAFAQRIAEGRNRPQTWGHAVCKDFTFDRTTSDWKGSTGLLCVKVLLEEGFERIVLAGVPMSKYEGHYYNAVPWHQAERYHDGWRGNLSRIRPYVRSMSGWTRDLLGEPDKAWLLGEDGGADSPSMKEVSACPV